MNSKFAVLLMLAISVWLELTMLLRVFYDVSGREKKKECFIHCERVLKGHQGSVNENHFHIPFSISSKPFSKSKHSNYKYCPIIALFTSSLIKVKPQGELTEKKIKLKHRWLQLGKLLAITLVTSKLAVTQCQWLSVLVFSPKVIVIVVMTVTARRN